MPWRYSSPLDHPLDSSNLRHSRSLEYLGELYRLVRIFTEERSRSILVLQDRQSGEFRSFQPIEKQVPLQIALEASEMIYNLRVALDYAFYALAKQAVADGRLSQADFVAIERELYFPIMDTPKKFAGWRKGSKGHWVTKSVCTVLEGAQPYKRPFMRLLGDLYHNLDKHRDIQPFMPKYAFTGGRFIPVPWEDESGALHTEPHPSMEPMGVYQGASVEVALPDGTPVVEALELLQSEVRALIDTLSLAF